MSKKLNTITLLVVPETIYTKIQSLDLDSSVLAHANELGSILTSDEFYFYNAVNKRLPDIVDVNILEKFKTTDIEVFSNIPQTPVDVMLKSLQMESRRDLLQYISMRHNTKSESSNSVINNYGGFYFYIDDSHIGYVPVISDNPNAMKDSVRSLINVIYKNYQSKPDSMTQYLSDDSGIVNLSQNGMLSLFLKHV